MVWAVINEDIRKAIAEFADSPSDRVCAVVGAAIVENALFGALELRLRADDPSERTFRPKKRFFAPSGPAGSLNAKIQLGYLLGMYDKTAVRALEAIASIRNLFAHKLSIVSFEEDDKLLKEGLENLKLHAAYKWYPHPLYEGDSNFEVEVPRNARDRFVINAKVLLVLFMRDHTMHLPFSNQFAPLTAAPSEEAREIPGTEEEALRKVPKLERS